MSDMWKTSEQRKYESETRKSVGEMLDEGCDYVMCMVGGYYKYKPDYKATVIVSYKNGVYKCSRGHSWNHAYAIDMFGAPLTVHNYNKMRSVV